MAERAPTIAQQMGRLCLGCLLALLAETGFAVPFADQPPDMIAWASSARGYVYDYRIDTQEIPGRVLLRMSTAVANIGTGPMELRGGTINSDGTQDVLQRIYNTSGGFTDRLAGRFTYHSAHAHIHFDRFAEYTLRELTTNNGVGQVIGTGAKRSFCLLDVSSYDLSRPGAPPSPRYAGCEQLQGISVGWADVYGDELPDQWIDVTDVPSGTYWVEVTADPDNQLVELNETNNTVRISVTFTNPRTPPPGVVVITNSSPGLFYAEAEISSLGSPMTVASNSLASAGQYIFTPSANTGTATLGFDIKEAGSYTLWCRVLAPHGQANSFFVSLDGTSEQVYDAAEGNYSNAWQWNKVSGRSTSSAPQNSVPRIFSLSSGIHRIAFRGREPGLFLDRIALSKDPAFVPSDGPPPPPPTNSASYYTNYFEAESGTFVSPMAPAAHSSASGGSYASSPTANSGTLTWNLDIPFTGNYTLWCRVSAGGIASNSFFYAVNGGTEEVYDALEGRWSTAWQWNKLSGRPPSGSPQNTTPKILALSAGTHRIVFRGREPRTLLDRLALSNHPDFVPVDGPPPPPPPATYRTLRVSSARPDSGVLIQVSQNDTNGAGDGVTTFTRYYSNNTTLTLTAPQTLGGGTNFVRWLRDGTQVTTLPAASVTVNADFEMTAVYEPPAPPGVSGALQFDGVDDYINISDQAVLRLTTPFTIEAWINRAASGVQHSIVEKYGCSGLGGYVLRVTPANKILFGTRDDCNAGVSVTGGTSLAVNTWYHVAGVWTGSALQIYLNGVLDGTFSSTRAPRSGTTPLRIGARGNDVGTPFRGSIDEVRLWNVARSAQQINDAMHLCATGTESGLAACWKLNEGNGPIAVDATGGGNTGTLVNGPIWISSILNCPEGVPTPAPLTLEIFRGAEDQSMTVIGNCPEKSTIILESSVDLENWTELTRFFDVRRYEWVEKSASNDQRFFRARIDSD